MQRPQFGIARGVHTSVNGHPYRIGLSSSSEVSSVRLAISFDTSDSVNVYAALVVEQTGDIYRDFHYEAERRNYAIP
jgi:hypothetical protein